MVRRTRTTSTKTAGTRTKAATAAHTTRMATTRKPSTTAADARLVERLRRICLALPEATEKVAWGEPTWRIRDRLFAQMDTHHHGADHVAVWMPAALGAQEALVEHDGERFFVPPYVGHRGWIGARLDRTPDWGVIAGLVEEAYRLVAPPRLLAGLRSAAPSLEPARRRSRK